jgi:hypothetical protein
MAHTNGGIGGVQSECKSRADDSAVPHVHAIQRSRTKSRGSAAWLAVATWVWVFASLPRHTAGQLGVKSVSPANAPLLGGSRTTLAGRMFGFEESSPRVRIGGTACEQVRGAGWVSDTAIVAVAPPAGANYNPTVVLTLQTLVIKTYTRGFTYDAPVITDVKPVSSPPDATQSITVLGKNFGAFGFSAVQVRIGDTAAVASRWLSTSSLHAKIPAGAHIATGKSAPIVLSVDAAGGPSLRTTVSKAFTYAPPALINLEEICQMVQRVCQNPANAPTVSAPTIFLVPASIV